MKATKSGQSEASLCGYLLQLCKHRSYKQIHGHPKAGAGPIEDENRKSMKEGRHTVSPLRTFAQNGIIKTTVLLLFEAFLPNRASRKCCEHFPLSDWHMLIITCTLYTNITGNPLAHWNHTFDLSQCTLWCSLHRLAGLTYVNTAAWRCATSSSLASQQ